MSDTAKALGVTRNLEEERLALLREMRALIPVEIQAAITLSLAVAAKATQEVTTITIEQSTNADVN